MNTPPAIRKVFQGVASRQQMFHMFDRHRQRPRRFEGDASAFYAGEWFEVDQTSHDYMFEILHPLWIRVQMFAMREFMTRSVTSVFFTLRIDNRVRYFHTYCDLSDTTAIERMRLAIIERESRPVRAMTRKERLEHIWSSTSDDYRRYADFQFPPSKRGRRAVTLHSGGQMHWKLLEDLTDDEITAKLPVHLRHLPDAIAA